MKQLLTILAIFISNVIVAQSWHYPKDTLKLPKSPGNMYTSMGYLKKYDTIPILYYTTDDTVVQLGYKSVYIKHGFYTDNDKTYNVLFNNKMKRIYTVRIYSFISK